MDRSFASRRARLAALRSSSVFSLHHAVHEELCASAQVTMHGAAQVQTGERKAAMTLLARFTAKTTRQMHTPYTDKLAVGTVKAHGASDNKTFSFWWHDGARRCRHALMTRTSSKSSQYVVSGYRQQDDNRDHRPRHTVAESISRVGKLPVQLE